MKIENLSTLKIHKLTQEQYDQAKASGNINENEVYLTPDDASESVSREEFDRLKGKFPSNAVSGNLAVFGQDGSLVDIGASAGDLEPPAITSWAQVKSICDANLAHRVLSVGDLIEDTYDGSPIEMRVVDLEPDQVILQPVTATVNMQLGDEYWGAEYGILERDYPAGTKILVFWTGDYLIYTTNEALHAGDHLCWIESCLGDQYGAGSPWGMYRNGTLQNYEEEYYTADSEEYNAINPDDCELQIDCEDGAEFVFGEDYNLLEASPPQDFSPEFAEVCTEYRAPMPKDVDLVWNYENGEYVYGFADREPLQYYYNPNVTEENWPDDEIELIDYGEQFWLGGGYNSSGYGATGAPAGYGSWAQELDYYDFCGVRNLYYIKGGSNE